MDDEDEGIFMPAPIPERYPLDALFSGFLGLLEIIENTENPKVAELAEATLIRTVNASFPLPSTGAGLKSVH